MTRGSSELGTPVEGSTGDEGVVVTDSIGKHYVVHSVQDYVWTEGGWCFIVRWDGRDAERTLEQESSVRENATPALSLHICNFFLKKSRLSSNFKGAVSRYFRQYVENGLLESESPDYPILARLANEELGIIKDHIVLPSTEDVARMRMRIKTLLAEKDYKSLLEKFGGKLKNFVKFTSKRMELRCHLAKWRDKIAEKEPNSNANIGIENNVDFEKPFIKFNYVTDYRVLSNVAVPPPRDKICSCLGGSCLGEKCCGTHFREGSKVPYPAYKLNRLNDPCRDVPLYECNSRCSCGPSCENRLIQQGCQLRLTIFRTCSRGWGVRADQRILKGTFIGEYVGELMRSKEAMRRHAKNFAYMFDLKPDKTQKEAEYTVDAVRHGNFTRFLNHSCNPNLRVNYAYIENHNPAAPRVAFFAKKDIGMGQELTFNYKMQKTDGSGSLTRMSCRCGAAKCKKFLF